MIVIVYIYIYIYDTSPPSSDIRWKRISALPDITQRKSTALYVKDKNGMLSVVRKMAEYSRVNSASSCIYNIHNRVK